MGQNSKTQGKSNLWSDFGSLFYQGDSNDVQNNQVMLTPILAD